VLEVSTLYLESYAAYMNTAPGKRKYGYCCI